MGRYICKRSLLMIPTLLGITLVCFFLIHLAPGSPIEQKISLLRLGGAAPVTESQIAALNQQYGFDQPLHFRYVLWLKSVVTLDFGRSFKNNLPVIDVILQKLPVSLQFGVLSLLVIYLISIPLGVVKAVRHGSTFDFVSTVSLMVLFSVPPLVLGILLRVYLAGGQFLDLFPLGDLYSDHYSEFSFGQKIVDRLHHLVLPLTCYVLNGFTVLTLLMKNFMLDEIKAEYVQTARAKGLEERRVIYKHALKNALIPILTGLGAYLPIFFGGSIIIERVFNLDGMGLLVIDSILARDYNVIMALILIQSVIAMLGRLVSDVTSATLDPRFNFK